MGGAAMSPSRSARGEPGRLARSKMGDSEGFSVRTPLAKREGYKLKTRVVEARNRASDWGERYGGGRRLRWKGGRWRRLGRPGPGTRRRRDSRSRKGPRSRTTRTRGSPASPWDGPPCPVEGIDDGGMTVQLACQKPGTAKSH